jgi:hypothetical protein
VIRPSLVTTGEEAVRLAKAGAFDRPTFLGSVAGEALKAGLIGPPSGIGGEALKAGILGLGGGGAGTKLDLGPFVTGAQTSQARIAGITKAMRVPVSLTPIPRGPSPEVMAMQGIRDAIAAQSELVAEQVRNTVRNAELLDESSRVQAEARRDQAAANRVMTGLTAALVVFTSVLVFEPWHIEPVGLVVGFAISAFLLQGTIRSYAARARRWLSHPS